MKAFIIALVSAVTFAATPALADRYDGPRGDRYERGGHGGDYYRQDRGRGGDYRGDRRSYGRDYYRGGYGRYAYGGGYYRPRGYGRPYGTRVYVAPVYAYGGYYGGPGYYPGPAYYGGGYYPVRYYGGGPRYYGGGRRYYDGYRCRTSGRGTVLGAIAGGLVGNVASSRYDRGVGTLLGAGVGAVAGTAIERDGRC
jgi:hypothetical protein